MLNKDDDTLDPEDRPGHERSQEERDEEQDMAWLWMQTNAIADRGCE